jgi:hypothetical protein
MHSVIKLKKQLKNLVEKQPLLHSLQYTKCYNEMKQFIDTLKNIFSIEDLRKRIFLTLGLLFIYRLGCFVVLPGVIPLKLSLVSKRYFPSI